MPVALEQHVDRLRPDALPPQRVEGLYVHIPFCFHKCHYCDFYSITRQAPQRMESFVDRLLTEADRWRTEGPAPQVQPRTVFFGGGTPSLLPLPAMRRLITSLRDRFDFSHLLEWTIECNPATVDLAYCEMLREMGVNRLSFGAQSFNATELATLERHHDPQDVPHSVELARRAGFDRLNVDLIYAVPGQTLESWSNSLEQAISLQTEHLSCYGLTYEANTPIAVRRRLGQLQETEESLELQMLRHARVRLSEIGMPAYEISNYARPGAECLHNLNYWLGGNYIGLGPSAASHVAGWRWKNRPHLGEWESAVDSGDVPVMDVERLSPSTRAGELAMLMLRLSRGIMVKEFRARTGHNPHALFADVIERFTRTNLLVANEQSIQLTEEGIAVADALASEFIACLDS